MTYTQLRALFVKRFSLPEERTLRRAVRSFSTAEKSVFYALVGIFIFSAIGMLYRVNNSYLVEVPIRGGTLSEGIVGNPRFINPVLAISEADKTLSSLIYSGLIRTSKEGKIEYDLIDSLEISSDGLMYTAHLKPDAKFHDGSKVTADDVVFTVQKIEDSAIKSPLFGDWAGVSAQKVDEETIHFILKSPYSPFIENLSVGILPKHIWKNVTNDEFAFSQFNTLPVGSGPYMINNVTRNSGGIPDYYDLVPFEESATDSTYIKHYVFHFYPSETDRLAAFESEDIDIIAGISPEEADLVSKEVNVLSSPLPRIFGVFFNQASNPALSLKEVRQALDLSAPKVSIVNEVLGGYGTPIDSPLPPSLFSWKSFNQDKSEEENLAEAKKLLENNGWTLDSNGKLEKISKKDTIHLSFSISTSNAPELQAVASKLKNSWEQLGAQVDIQVFETGDLNQNVIRPRKFEALLFGEVIGKDADLYPFWHSSQRNDPGLNIALYANSKVDKLLEDARKESDPEKREAAYKEFDKEIQSDMPLVSLYAPNFIYVVPKDVKAVTLGNLSVPSDRFNTITQWYLDTDNVWKLFVR